MQTLWSRTGLSHRCACRACEQVLGAGRRATTKASRRKATFAEAFTALYSSFLATAAVVDAVRKEDRKAKVDAELEDVRNELSELRAKRALHELQFGIPEQRLQGDNIPLSDLSDMQNRALWEQWRQIYDREDFLDDAWKATGATEETLSFNRSHVRPFGGTRLEPTTILRAECTRIMRHIQTEEHDDSLQQPPFEALLHFESAVSRIRSYIKGMLVMADQLCEKRHMPRTSLKHIRRDNPHLVGDRARRSHIKSRWPPANGAREPQISALVQAWHAFDSPVPDYWFQGHPLQKEHTIHLNEEIREIFRDRELPLDELLGHISLTILRSPALPDVHTLNLLMAGFTRRRLHVMASSAYELFFQDTSKLHSTPASLALSVTKPAMFWDIAAFKRAAGAIIGRDPMIGAKIERYPLEDVTHDGFVLSWSTDSARRGIAGRWVNAYAPMNLALREALISSLLHLRQHVDAASFFLACLQTGASVAAGVVFELFNAIAKTPDARSAVRLIRGLSVRSRKFGELLSALPEDIRGCVCRRLDYLLHIVNLGKIDMEFADEVMHDLGMRRRHLESLHGLLEEHGYSNESMNEVRSTFDMYSEGLRAVSSSTPRALGKAKKSHTPTTARLPLKASIAQWAPDVDSDQVSRKIHEQIRRTVQVQVEKQIREQARETIKLEVQAHLRRYRGDVKSSQTLAPGDQSDAMDPEHRVKAARQAVSDDTEDILRRQIEEDIETAIKLQVQRQVEEQLSVARRSSRELKADGEPVSSSQQQAAPASDQWRSNEYFTELRHVGNGS